VRNNEKQEAYASLKGKLKVALKYEFWFEACMIEYAIIEDRTASILAHVGTCRNPYEKKLSNKLNAIEQLIGKRHPIISKKVKPEELSQVRTWKEKRNALTHSFFKIQYGDSDLKNIALEGKIAMDAISNAAQRVSKMSEREIEK
jgi:hypothetical protein